MSFSRMMKTAWLRHATSFHQLVGALNNKAYIPCVYYRLSLYGLCKLERIGTGFGSQL